MKFSMVTLLGFILGWGVIIAGIALNNVGFGPYISISSLFITIGGTICAVMIGAPNKFFSGFSKYMNIIFSKASENYNGVIDMLVTLADRARKDGLLALEDEIVDIPDDFTRKGLQMIIDGTDPDVIKHTLYIQMDEMQSRHEQIQNTFDLGARLSPAFGLLGTIIGLIALLGNIGGDPAAIGRGMQIALITTLYGALFSYLILTPMVNKLKEKDVDEIRRYSIIMEGILSIQAGENPRIVKDRLLAFLSNEERERMLMGDDA